MPTDACSKPSTNNYAADLGAGPARASCPQNRKSKLAVSASFAKNSFLLPRGERLQQFPAVRHRALLPVGPADYHFRYLLLIGEKERLILRSRAEHLNRNQSAFQNAMPLIRGAS